MLPQAPRSTDTLLLFRDECDADHAEQDGGQEVIGLVVWSDNGIDFVDMEADVQSADFVVYLEPGQVDD